MDDLKKAFELCLHPSTIKEGERRLAVLGQSDMCLDMLLSFLEGSSRLQLDPAVLSLAVVFLKNQVSTKWGSESLLPEKAGEVRQRLVSILFLLGDIPRPYFEVLRAVAEKDYPHLWPSFIVELLAHCNKSNPEMLLRLFMVLDVAFEKFRQAEKTDDALLQTLDVVDKIGPLLLETTKSCIEFLSTEPQVGGQYSLLARVLNACLSVYRSLLSYDIPQYFDDRRDDVFSNLENVLLLWARSSTQSVRDILFDPMLNCVELLIVYSTRYVEDLSRLKELAEVSLAILKMRDSDNLVVHSVLVRFIASIVGNDSVREIFRSHLDFVIRQVIFPLSTFSEEDLELLEEDPLEFARREQEQTSNDESVLNSTITLAASLSAIFPSEFHSRVLSMVSSALADNSTSASSKESAVLILALICSSNDANLGSGNSLFHDAIGLSLSSVNLASRSPTLLIALLRLALQLQANVLPLF